MFDLSTFSLPVSQWERDVHKLVFFILFLSVSQRMFLSPDLLGRHMTGPQPPFRTTVALLCCLQCEFQDFPGLSWHGSIWAMRVGLFWSPAQPRHSVCGCASVKGKGGRQFPACFCQNRQQMRPVHTLQLTPASGSHPSALPFVN